MTLLEWFFKCVLTSVFAVLLLALNPPKSGIVLVPCRPCKCTPTAISGGVDISEVPGCHLL